MGRTKATDKPPNESTEGWHQGGPPVHVSLNGTLPHTTSQMSPPPLASVWGRDTRNSM